MSAHRLTSWHLAIAVFWIVLGALPLSAQERGRRGGLWGDWQVKAETDGRSWESILSFSRNADGQRTGHWISMWGMSEIEDLSFEDGKLTFVQRRTNREGETMTSKFTGTIAEGKLSGTVSSERGEMRLTGERMPWNRRAVGHWETKFKVGDREITNTLVISSAEDGALKVDWKSDRVQHTISDVEYSRGRLTFKSHAKMDDREWDSTFEGQIERDALTGVIKSERGEMALTGSRLGAAVIGDWILTISSDRGERQQRLRVLPDMSALYGATKVSRVELGDGRLGFTVSYAFGDRTWESTFKGRIDGDQISGELTSTRGTSKVTGKKAPRPERRRGPGGRAADRTF